MIWNWPGCELSGKRRRGYEAGSSSGFFSSHLEPPRVESARPKRITLQRRLTVYKPTLAIFALLTLLYIFLTAITVSSCEIATALRVENGNPPKIIMSGSGSLGRLMIRGPKTFRKSLGPDSWAYWCIEPKDKDGL